MIEYNWRLPGITGSYDQALSNTDRSERIPFDLAGMFDFDSLPNRALTLDPSTGQPLGH